MPRVSHDRSFWDKFLLNLALESMDMCHDTIMIEIPILFRFPMGLGRE